MASSRSCSSEGRSTSPHALHHESTLLMYCRGKKRTQAVNRTDIGRFTWAAARGGRTHIPVFSAEVTWAPERVRNWARPGTAGAGGETRLAILHKHTSFQWAIETALNPSYSECTVKWSDTDSNQHCCCSFSRIQARDSMCWFSFFLFFLFHGEYSASQQRSSYEPLQLFSVGLTLFRQTNNLHL